MSSSEVAIAARGVGKSYSILHRREPGPRQGGSIVENSGRFFRRMDRETIWALRDVSFDIPRGEVVGLIGRNGAGKSTLLKLLSRITEPSRGEIGLWGRVGSLLEVGTGFHPELTGRENIYLNGSILGMRRGEIRAHFDDIVAFSGVEKFLDTPVKRYSSGMYVRLAFSVAVHLKPEILIVDEVLAVGDGDFQRRCLQKMDEVARAGRTILLVSHNMGSIRTLCSRALYLEHGRLVRDGPAEEVVAAYLSSILTMAGSTKDDPEERVGDGSIRIRNARIRSGSGADRELNTVMGGEDVALELDYESRCPGRYVSMLVNLYNEDGQAVTSAHTELTRPDLAPLARRGRLRCLIRRLPLTLGSYRVAVAVQVDGKTADYLPRAATLDVVASVFHPTGKAPDSRTAAFLIDHCWDHQPDPEPEDARLVEDGCRG